MKKFSDAIYIVASTLAIAFEWILFLHVVHNSEFCLDIVLVISGVALIALTVMWATVLVSWIIFVIYSKKEDSDDIS